jgi:hypothetical protein
MLSSVSVIVAAAALLAVPSAQAASVEIQSVITVVRDTSIASAQLRSPYAVGKGEGIFFFFFHLTQSINIISTQWQ